MTSWIRSLEGIVEKYNVLYICNYAADFSGNFIASLSKLASEALKKYNGVYFLFNNAAKDKSWLCLLPVPKDHIFFSAFDFRSLNAKCQQLNKLLRDTPTIVHTHFVEQFGILPVRLHFKRILVHHHMTAPNLIKFRHYVKRLLLMLLYCNLTIIGVSEAVSEDLQKYYKLSQCMCITNAIVFDHLEKCAISTSNPHFLTGTSFRILMHGSHFDRKGVPLAICALEKLDPQYRDKCVLYVTCHDLAHTEQLIADCGSSFSHIRPIAVVEDIKNLYDSADLFISPSSSEAFGYAVAEAAYSKCQVLASDVPGQNTMKDIPSILWVASDNPESLCHGIMTAIYRALSGETIRYKQAQREYVAAHYGIDQWINQIVKLYQEKVCS